MQHMEISPLNFWEWRTAGQSNQFLYGTTGGGRRHSYITNLAPSHSSLCPHSNYLLHVNRTVDICLLCLLVGWCCNLNLENCCPLRRDALKIVKHIFHYCCQAVIPCYETASFKASSLTIWKEGQNTIKQRLPFDQFQPASRWVALYFQPISWR